MSTSDGWFGEPVDFLTQVVVHREMNDFFLLKSWKQLSSEIPKRSEGIPIVQETIYEGR